MERFGDRKGKMDRYCLTGQSPQRAVAPTEEEEVKKFTRFWNPKYHYRIYNSRQSVC
jgi:hypothetical protein